MPFPLPAANDELLAPPDAVEAQFLARGVATAIAPIGGLTLLQGVLMQSMFEAMTGHEVDLGNGPSTRSRSPRAWHDATRLSGPASSR